MNGKILEIKDPGGTRPLFGYIMGDDGVKLCLSIRKCIKRASKNTQPCQHRFGF